MKPSYYFAKYQLLLTYFLVASIGVAIQLIVSSISQHIFHISFENSLIWGYGIAFIVGFLLTKIVAFKKRNVKGSMAELVRYVFVSLISGIITVKGAIWINDFLNQILPQLNDLYFFNKPIAIKKLIAHLSSMGLSFIFNFTSHKYFTFKPK